MSLRRPIRWAKDRRIALALGPDVALSRRVALSRARGALSSMGVRSTLWTSRAAAKSPSLSWPALFQDRSLRPGLASAQSSSGMLSRYRRFFAVAAFLLLVSPLVAGLVYPDGAASILAEGRTPAPALMAPVDSADWIRLPSEIDAYLQDHIGLRQALLRMHRELSKPLL